MPLSRPPRSLVSYAGLGEHQRSLSLTYEPEIILQIGQKATLKFFQKHGNHRILRSYHVFSKTVKNGKIKR